MEEYCYCIFEWLALATTHEAYNKGKDYAPIDD